MTDPTNPSAKDLARAPTKAPGASPALSGAATGVFLKPFDAVLKLESDDGGHLFVDGRTDPPAITETPPDGEVNCYWRGSEETLIRVLDGERALESAFVAGRLSIAGNMSVMVRIELNS